MRTNIQHNMDECGAGRAYGVFAEAGEQVRQDVARWQGPGMAEGRRQASDGYPTSLPMTLPPAFPCPDRVGRGVNVRAAHLP